MNRIYLNRLRREKTAESAMQGHRKRDFVPTHWSLGLGLGFDGLSQKAGWISPSPNVVIVKEENPGVKYYRASPFFSTTSPTLVMGRNRPHLPARSRRNHRPAEYRV